MLKDDIQITGSTTDWVGFEKAREERWRLIGPHQYHCELHGTYFDPDGYSENDFQDAEPCWECNDEFTIKL